MCDIKCRTCGEKIYLNEMIFKPKCMICDKPITDEGLFEFLDGGLVFYCNEKCRNYEWI